MNLNQFQSFPSDRVHGLFGLEPAALGLLLADALPEILVRRTKEQQQKPERRRAVGGGRSRRLRPYQEVLLTLVYLRHNVSHAVARAMFGVSADIPPIKPQRAHFCRGRPAFARHLPGVPF